MTTKMLKQTKRRITSLNRRMCFGKPVKVTRCVVNLMEFCNLCDYADLFVWLYKFAKWFSLCCIVTAMFTKMIVCYTSLRPTRGVKPNHVRFSIQFSNSQLRSIFWLAPDILNIRYVKRTKQNTYALARAKRFLLIRKTAAAVDICIPI